MSWKAPTNAPETAAIAQAAQIARKKGKTYLANGLQDQQGIPHLDVDFRFKKVDHHLGKKPEPPNVELGKHRVGDRLFWFWTRCINAPSL